MAEGKGGAGMYVRLQLAYALEFAIWGAWSYMLGTWASAHHVAQGSLYAAFALGALFAPLVGPIADRKFAAQKVFAFMQAVCGLALLACAFLASKEGRLADLEFAKNAAYLAKPSFAWQAMMFVAGFFFLPSIPLLNAIVFKHIPNGSKTPFVFIFGTIGWIVVNWVLSAMGTAGVEYFYIVDGAIAFALAVYALTLPNTPPSGAKNNDPFGLKALALFKRWDFAVFMTCATLVGIFGSNYYFAFVGMCFPDKGVFNQYSELIFMAALAFAAAKIGLKWVLTLGMLAWGVRYMLFATGNDPMAVVGILCHGLAYAFLYTAAYMYGDKIAKKDQKASVQALIAFLLLGVAQYLSGVAVDKALVWGLIPNNSTSASAVVIQPIQSAFAQDVSVNDVATSDVEDVAVVEDATSDVAPSDGASGDVSEDDVSDALETVVPDVVDAQNDKAPSVVDSSTPKSNLSVWWDKGIWAKYRWKYMWGIPGLFCLVFAVLFALLGKEPKAPEESEEESETK